MNKEKLNINGIPAILWGEKSSKVFIAVHGNMSNKEDEVIEIFAEKVTNKGFQVLSFDLPEHGERKDDKAYLCKVQNCVKDLKIILEYAKANFDEINLWACSMGAYFSLLAFKDDEIKNSYFLSPIVNMKVLIDNMMTWANVTEADLKDKKEIKTDFGQTLYWDYYEFVKANPITTWNSETFILYGQNDDLQAKDLIQDFCDKFNCNLTVLEGGDHFFHTEEQIDFYARWIEENI